MATNEAWGDVHVLPFTPLLNDNTSWMLRTDTYTISPSAVSSLVVSFRLQGALVWGGISVGADLFLIYDCTLRIIYADGSRATFRPLEFQALINSFYGSPSSDIVAPGSIVDANPASATTIELSAVTLTEQFAPFLQTRSFLPWVKV
jgi:hypothetical protein